MSVAFPSDRVLITGSSGFTGRILAHTLSHRGCDVSGISKNPTEPWEYKIDLTAATALDELLNEVRPEVIIHLAGIASPVHGSVVEIYETNVAGTAALLSALRKLVTKPRLVLVASSAAVYAQRDDGRSQREDDMLEPINDYGVSKLAVEQMCRLSRSNLPIRVVRPFNYTGSGQSETFLIPKIVDHFVRDIGEIKLGNLDLDRDISDVTDTVEAYARLMSRAPGPTLNLCSGVPIRLAKVVDLLRDISGRPMNVITDRSLVRANEPKVIIGDRSALDAEIGTWERRPLKRTLEEMYQARIVQQHSSIQ